MRSRRSIIVSSTIQHEPPWYGTVCPVVWEDGGSNPASYPIIKYWGGSWISGVKQPKIP